ncbi:NYN domain-containing protein [Coprothermobacteraceae bacterium]|nr:NYN domain-containing protein [Coprothermobacteraceae bacterium]
MESNRRFAIYLDLENLAKSLEKYDKTPQELMQKLLDYLRAQGKIDLARIYTGWGVFASLVPFAVDIGYEAVFVYTHRGGTVVKNLADMQITVDALKCGYERPQVTTFVFVSADRDFLPVIKALQELGREVIVIGDEQITSTALKNAADRFLPLTELAGDLKSVSSNRAGKDFEGFFRKLGGIIGFINYMGYELSPSILKELLTMVIPDFTERDWGYPNFKALVRDLEKRGLVEIIDSSKMKMVASSKVQDYELVVPEDDIQKVKELLHEGISGRGMVEALRNIDKQGLRGGKDYWEALIRLGNENGWWSIDLGGAESEEQEAAH